MAIIPILAMVVVLVAAGSAALLTGHTSMKGIKLNERAIKALEIAEAGIGFSVQELDLNQDLNKTESSATSGALSATARTT